MRHLLPLAAVLVLLPCTRAADPPSLKAVEEQMQQVIEDVTPTVVAIVVSHAEYPPDTDRKKKPGQLGGYESSQQPDDRRFGRRGWPGQRQLPLDRLDLTRPENTADHLFGSGVVLDPQAGLVLVPYHLIDGATKVYVRASDGSGSYADIFASDSKSDLAVLKLISPPAAGMKAVRFADVRLADTPDGKKATVKRGSWVIAVGHPLAAGAGDGSPSASWGIVSNTNRASAPPPVQPEANSQKPLHAYGGLIQVDARITLGSSGTGVFDSDGRLVGLGSAVAAVYGSEASGGYAVPLDRNYRKIIDTLKAGREVEYGFLGIEPASHPDGVVANSITPTCPAAAAGLYPNDVITAVDGHPLRKDGDLLLRVGAALAGTEVTLEYRRDGGPPKTAKAVLAKNNNPLPFLATVPPPAVHGLTVEYQSTKFSGAGGRMMRNPPNPPPGVVIRELERGSAADKKFQELGPSRGWWVITHVDGKPVTTPAEFHAAVKGKAGVKLLLADSDDPTNRPTVTLP